MGSTIAWGQAVQGANPAAAATPPAVARDYAGPQEHIPGLYVTPVANAPFSATVQILSHVLLPNGSEHTVTTINHIARSSSGRIYNERRKLVPVGFVGEPRLIRAHIYDPSSRLNIYVEPEMRIAREVIETHAPALTPGPIATGAARPGEVESDLGEQTFAGMTVHGLRRSRTVEPSRSGTGKEVIVTDEYWYSPVLHIYLTLRHEDPRSGEQLISVTDIHQGEPDASLFVPPAEYRVVDETPAPR